MVTPIQVRQIIETELTDEIITSYIDSASALVDSILTDIPTSLSDEIKRWLTAHFIACTRERQPQSAEAGPANITFQGETGFGLDATLYGQQVKVLDYTGRLASLGLRKAAIRAVPND